MTRRRPGRARHGDLLGGPRGADLLAVTLSVPGAGRPPGRGGGGGLPRRHAWWRHEQRRLFGATLPHVRGAVAVAAAARALAAAVAAAAAALAGGAAVGAARRPPTGCPTCPQRRPHPRRRPTGQEGGGRRGKIPPSTPGARGVVGALAAVGSAAVAADTAAAEATATSSCVPCSKGGALSCALGGDLGGLLPLLLSRPDDGGGSGSCGTGDWGGRRWQRARWGVVPTGGLIAAPAGWSGGWQQSVSGPHLDGGRHPRGSVGATATGATAVAAALPAAIRAVATAAGRRLGRPPPCQHWQWQWP